MFENHLLETQEPIVQPIKEDGGNLKCRAQGVPSPKFTWSIINKDEEEKLNKSPKFNVSDVKQLLTCPLRLLIYNYLCKVFALSQI